MVSLLIDAEHPHPAAETDKHVHKLGCSLGRECVCIACVCIVCVCIVSVCVYCVCEEAAFVTFAKAPHFFLFNQVNVNVLLKGQGYTWIVLAFNSPLGLFFKELLVVAAWGAYMITLSSYSAKSPSVLFFSTAKKHLFRRKLGLLHWTRVLQDFVSSYFPSTRMSSSTPTVAANLQRVREEIAALHPPQQVYHLFTLFC